MGFKMLSKTMKRLPLLASFSILIVPVAIVTGFLFRQDGVKTEYFAVVAQVIPVLVLAFIVESRKIASNVLEAKLDGQRNLRFLDATRDLIDNFREDTGRPQALEQVREESDSDPLNHSEEVASLELTVDSEKKLTLVTAFSAAFGEVLALFALASGSTSTLLFFLTLGTVFTQGGVLVATNSIAMEALKLKMQGKVHVARAQEIRDRYESAMASYDRMVARLGLEVALSNPQDESKPPEPPPAQQPTPD